MVAVDDVQWVDDPSLAWLGYLARRAGDLAQLLVLGLRSGDPGGERGELEGLVGADRVERVVLAVSDRWAAWIAARTIRSIRPSAGGLTRQRRHSATSS